MTNEDAIAVVIDVLEQLQIPYLLVGAFASNAYCVPRATNDADFVLTLEPGQLTMFAAQLGPEFRLNPQVLFETITLTKRHELVHLPTCFLIELFRQGDDAHHAEQFRRRRRQFMTDLQRAVWIPTAEDVLIQKLRWQRNKDIDDVKGVVAVCRQWLDWDYVNQWATQHGTLELLQQVRESLPHFDGIDEE